MVHMKNEDGNMETYSIFWLDESAHNKQNMAAQHKLRSIINRLRIFVDPEEFINRVRCIKQGDITNLIVSGQMGRTVIPKIHELAQVKTIYVYCHDIKTNKEWSQSYSKVRALMKKKYVN